MKEKGIIAVLLLVFILTGCGSTAGNTAASTPTTLHITRTNNLYHIPPFDRTITDTDKVQQLYAAAYALPAAPSGVHPCSDIHATGTVYHLDFLHGNVLLQEMILDTSGCRDLLIGKTDERKMDDAFISLFLKTAQLNSLNPPPS